MSINLDRLVVENNLLDRLKELERKVERLQKQPVQAMELAEITNDAGEIQAGLVGGWNIGADELKSQNYAAGSAGASIQGSTGDAEFNNIKARGAFRASVFEKGSVTATSGTQGWFKSAGKLKADVTTVASPTTFTIDIDDPESGHAALFAVDDILRIKDLSGDNWLKVGTVTDNTTYYTYTCTLENGSAATFTAGVVVVNYGVSGDGFLLATADDTNAPFFAVYIHAGEPWTIVTEVARLGNLNGALDYLADHYGIAIGDENGYLKYDPVNGFSIGFGNDSIKLTDAGLTVEGEMLAYTHNVELDSGASARLQLGTSRHPNNEKYLVAGIKHDGLFPEYSFDGEVQVTELLGTNRGWEDETEAQFTVVKSTGEQNILVSTGAHEGSFCRQAELYLAEEPSGDQAIVSIVTNKVAATEGLQYGFSVWTKKIYGQLYSGSTITQYIKAHFYTSSDTLISSQTISTNFITSTSWTQHYGTYTAPTGTAKVALEVYMKIAKGAFNGGSRFEFQTDLFSIQGEAYVGTGGSWGYLQRQNSFFLQKWMHFLDEDENLYKVMALPQGITPPGALTATVSATAGNVDVGTHSYKVTFVDDYGETQGGTASTQITVATSGKLVNLTAIPISKDGVTRTRKIYRTKAGDNGEYYFLAEIMDNTTVTYDDDIADAALGDLCPINNTSGSDLMFQNSWIGSFTQFKFFQADGTQLNADFQGNYLTAFASGSGMYPTTTQANNGDYYTCKFLIAAGQYVLNANYSKNTVRGKCDLYIDGVKVNSTTLDLYASAAAQANWQITGIQIAQSGMHEIKIVVNGKNASSTDYQAAFGLISLSPWVTV